MTIPRVYGLKGVSNMRDLGGYLTKSGKKTAMGRFIRSAALSGFRRDVEDGLRELGVDCVIDLRSSREREIAPNVIVSGGAVHYEHIPMLDYISSNFATGDFTNFPSSMTEMYTGLLEHSGKDFAGMFRIFADDRFGGFLFHCTAGKDRTGVTAMLLLGLAGVPDEIITEDYALTESLLGTVPMSKSLEKLPRYLFEAKPETMQATIKYVRERYGGVEEYLETLGVGADTRGRVLERLLEA